MRKDLRNLGVVVVERYKSLLMRIVDPALNSFCEEYGEKFGFRYNEKTIYSAQEPEKGLELLGKKHTDISIFNVNIAKGIDKDKGGIYKFLIPARERGFSLPIIAYSYDIKDRWGARRNGADEFVCSRSGEVIWDLREAIAFVLETKQKSESIK